jgi:hypothetical protein
MKRLARPHRVALAALAALQLGAAAGTPVVSTPLEAQPVDGGVVRRLKYTLAGAAVGSVLATAYYAVSDPEDRESGCKPWSCVLPYLTGSGALTGLFLSREIAMQRAADMPRLAARERATFSTLALPGTFSGLLAADTLVYVVGDSGVAVVGRADVPRALRRRANGLRGLRDIALVPGSTVSGADHRLLLASDAALYHTSAVSGPIARVVGGPISAVAASPARWVAARGGTLFTGSAVTGTATVRDSLGLGLEVRAAVVDGSTGHFWVATDSSVLEIRLSPEGVASRGRAFPVSTPVHALAVSAGHLVAATRAQQLLVWSRTAMTNAIVTPETLPLGAAYPYDMAFRGEELFVAAGAEGVLRIAMTPALDPLGTITDVRFATHIRVDGDGTLWVTDRARQALVKLLVPAKPIYR